MTVEISNTFFREMFYRSKQKDGAVYKKFNDGAIVKSYQNPQLELQQFKSLAICDLSIIKRIGFKGADTNNFLSKYLELPKLPNTFIKSTKENHLVAKLSSNEYLIIDNFNAKSSIYDTLDKEGQLKKGKVCYKLYRQHSHCLFMVSGKYASDILAKLCGVNLSRKDFVLGSVAQTSLARVASIIMADSIDDIEVFYILSDTSSAEYLWYVLLDAFSEYGGRPIGCNFLKI